MSMDACHLWLNKADREPRIKRAYRKKALELHPDRNYGNVENATKLFAEIQSAYEVLSDPHERAWYDSHRDAILRNRDYQGAEHYEHDVRVTTAEDILRIFAKINGRIDYSDSASGFYTMLRETFDTLSREEGLACDWENLDPITYPSFGHADDSYEDVVRPFYNTWNGFATKKTFSWKDVYRYSEAPDRRVRRMMEKENKRLRDEGIREFNDAVRSLVTFVKKRDPRFRPNTHTEVDRQKYLRDAAAAQAARSRAANQVKLGEHILPEWAKREIDVEEDSQEEEEGEAQEQFECVVCNKTFKSEKQYETHEKSKRHVKAVQQLRRRMETEAEVFGLDGHDSNGLGTTDDKGESNSTLFPHTTSYGLAHDQNKNYSPESSLGPEQDSDDPVSATEASPHKPFSTKDIEDNSQNEAVPSESDDEYASRDKVEQRILGREFTISASSVPALPVDNIAPISSDLAFRSLSGDSEASSLPKIGKAKEKRAKKAAQKISSEGGGPQSEVSILPIHDPACVNMVLLF